MKAIIMAAGIGSRLKKQLGNQPKCCTEVGGEALIERMLRLLAEKGIRDVALVLGYQSEVVIGRLRGKTEARFYVNPFFNVTNSISSLWFAREELDGQDDTVILNGDLFFEASLLDAVVESTGNAVMFADPRRIEDADYRFGYDNGLLRRYGKNLTVADTTGEYIGIAKIRRGLVGEFRAGLEVLVAAQQHGLWWEDVLYNLCATKRAINVVEITDSFWAEVDYIEDYERIQAFLRNSRAETVAEAAQICAPQEGRRIAV
jgi:L-glutamine-phosphate cytidylyltransferase